MSLQHQDRLWAYIQLPSTAPTQTVNTGLYRLLQPLDELIVPILGQAYVRYPSVGLGTCPQSIIIDQITDHYAPYCDDQPWITSDQFETVRGPEHIGKSGPNGVVMLAQVSDEEKLTEHMKFVREMAAKMGMNHEIYKLAPDSR